jgi:hypothetical protein
MAMNVASRTWDWQRVRDAASRLTTPLHPDDYLSMINPLWTSRELRGKVEQVIPETEDAATLVIRPGWGWSPQYTPGQYIGIGVEVEGRYHWRSYSLSSPAVRRKGLITITVRAMPEGFLSDHLVRGLEPGTIVRLATPAGEFTLPKLVTRSCLRARSPSILSVSIASPKISTATQRHSTDSPSSTSSAHAKNGTITMRSVVSALGTFQLLTCRVSVIAAPLSRWPLSRWPMT